METEDERKKKKESESNEGERPLELMLGGLIKQRAKQERERERGEKHTEGQRERERRNGREMKGDEMRNEQSPPLSSSFEQTNKKNSARVRCSLFAQLFARGQGQLSQSLHYGRAAIVGKRDVRALSARLNGSAACNCCKEVWRGRIFAMTCNAIPSCYGVWCGHFLWSRATLARWSRPLLVFYHRCRGNCVASVCGMVWKNFKVVTSRLVNTMQCATSRIKHGSSGAKKRKEKQNREAASPHLHMSLCLVGSSAHIPFGVLPTEPAATVVHLTVTTV